MEFVAGIGIWFAAWVFTWPFLFILFIGAILCDHSEESGWEIVLLIASAFVGFHLFNLSWTQLFIAVAAYVPIGILWSVFRWKRHCNKIVQKVQDGVYNDRSGSAKEELNPRNKTEDLVFWIVIWPASVLSEIFGDFIDFVRNLVKKHLQGAYAKISSDALSKLDNIENGVSPSGVQTDIIIAALGGASNFVHIDSDITRLRVTLRDNSVIDDEAIKKTGAAGVVKLGAQNVQIICGPSADKIARELKAVLDL